MLSSYRQNIFVILNKQLFVWWLVKCACYINFFLILRNFQLRAVTYINRDRKQIFREIGGICGLISNNYNFLVTTLNIAKLFCMSLCSVLEHIIIRNCFIRE